MHVLDADELVPVLDADAISASIVFQVPAIIVIQKNNAGIYAAKLIANIGFRQRRLSNYAPVPVLSLTVHFLSLAVPVLSLPILFEQRAFSGSI